MNVAIVIDRRGRGVVLSRTIDGGFSRDPDTYGDALPNHQEKTLIRAVIQPAGARDAKYLASLAEGIQTETRLVMWTRAEVHENDTVEDGSKRYRVIESEDRSYDGNYFVAYLGSVQDD